MFYFRGNDFEEALNTARRKHVPLFFELDVWADTPSMYHGAGPIGLFLSYGELNRCRKTDMDPALAKRIGVGKVFRMTTGKNDTRYIFKLWYTNKKGYYADPHSHKEEGRVERIFDVPEDLFLRWIVEDTDKPCVTSEMEAEI